MHLFKSILILTLLCATITLSYAQYIENGYPAIGEQCPSFQLDGVENFKTSNVSLSELKGQNVILDFWSAGCATCVESFPKVNHFQAEYKNNLQFFLVGRDDKYIRPMYVKFREKQKLNLAAAFDSSLFNRFVYGGAPLLVWINKNGVVAAITSSDDLTEENIKQFINGQSFPYNNRSYEFKTKNVKNFDEMHPLLVNNNGGSDTSYYYRSIIGPWNYRISQSIVTSIKAWNSRVSKKSFAVCGANINFLIRLATVGVFDWYFGDSLYGKVIAEPFYNMEDRSITQFNYTTGKNVFNYSIELPDSNNSINRIMRLMRRNLEDYFDISVNIKDSAVNYWALVCLPEFKEESIKTKGGLPSRKGNHSGYTIQNLPLSSLISTFANKHHMEPPFIDETRIKYNIDISFDALDTDLGDIQRELRKHNLDLVKKVKTMSIIVVKNRIDNN